AGPTTLTAIELTDAMPAAVLNPQYSTNGNGSYDVNSGAWTGLDLGEGQTVVLTIVGTVDANFSGLLSNTAVVTPTGAIDPALTNNQDDDQNFAQITPTADLSLSKSSAPNPYLPGQPIPYPILVTNAGPTTLTALQLADAMPAVVLNP